MCREGAESLSVEQGMSCESAVETPTEHEHSDMSGCYLEAYVGRSCVSEAFRVF